MTIIDRARAFIGLSDPAPKWPPDRLSLALQGGGSFGAFTWGVLDRLLEEPGIDFDAISGASAGAVNAVLMAAGMVDGGPDEARACLERGAYLSFSGIVTFKNAAPVREAATLCPLDRLLVETDSPFLAPVPHRGTRNEPGLVSLVGAFVAELKGLEPSTVAASSSEAASRAFAIAAS